MPSACVTFSLESLIVRFLIKSCICLSPFLVIVLTLFMVSEVAPEDTQTDNLFLL